jgi:hypothetical protein
VTVVVEASDAVVSCAKTEEAKMTASVTVVVVKRILVGKIEVDVKFKDSQSQLGPKARMLCDFAISERSGRDEISLCAWLKMDVYFSRKIRLS